MRRTTSSIPALDRRSARPRIGDKLDERSKIKLANLEHAVVALARSCMASRARCRCRLRSATSCAIRARRNTPPTRRAKKPATSPASRRYIQARWGKPVAGRPGARQSADRNRALAAGLEEDRRHADAGRGPRHGRLRDASIKRRTIRLLVKLCQLVMTDEVAPARSPWSCNTTPRLLTSVATFGWSGPKAASSILRARSKAAFAPARSPRSCNTPAQVVDVCSHIRMVGTEGGFIDLEGALEGGFRTRQIAQVLQHHAQVVDVCSHIRMVGTEGGFIDLEGALEGGFRTRIIGQCSDMNTNARSIIFLLPGFGQPPPSPQRIGHAAATANKVSSFPCGRPLHCARSQCQPVFPQAPIEAPYPGPDGRHTLPARDGWPHSPSASQAPAGY